MLSTRLCLTRAKQRGAAKSRWLRASCGNISSARLRHKSPEVRTDGLPAISSNVPSTRTYFEWASALRSRRIYATIENSVPSTLWRNQIDSLTLSCGWQPEGPVHSRHVFCTHGFCCAGTGRTFQAKSPYWFDYLDGFLASEESFRIRRAQACGRPSTLCLLDRFRIVRTPGWVSALPSHQF